MRDKNVPNWMKLYEKDFEPSEELEGENNVGVELPKHLKKNSGTGIANNWIINLKIFFKKINLNFKI